MNNLILGYGRLGKELAKQSDWKYISRDRDDFDICSGWWNNQWYKEQFESYDVIINTIAYTDTYSGDRKKHFDTNFTAVCNLTDWCNRNSKKLIQISTDYVYAGSRATAKETDLPIPSGNWYTLSKLAADFYIESSCNSFLIMRTSFKPRPWVYPKAFFQLGNFDYIDTIASLMIKLIENNAEGIYNVGTEVKSLRDLALMTNPNIEMNYDHIDDSFPSDVTMDISKMKNFLFNKGVKYD